MKYKVIKTILIAETIMMTILPIINVHAQTIDGAKTGEATENEERMCSTWDHARKYEACGDFGSDFAVRITLTNENGQRVEGTKTIELIPSDDKTSKKLTPEDIVNIRFKSNLFSQIFNHEPEKDFKKYITTYYNSSIRFKDTESAYIILAGTTVISGGDKNGQEIYKANIFTKKFKTTETDASKKFLEYKNSFLDYLTSGRTETKKYKRDIDGDLSLDEKVSLLDFILVATGYSDTAEAAKLSGKETLTPKEKWDLPIGTLKDKNYKLVIEPVYQLLYREYDSPRIIEGTGKQMAEFVRYNINNRYTIPGNDANYYFGYWVTWRGTEFFNLACNAYSSENMIGKTGTGNICAKESTFKTTYPLNQLYSSIGKVFVGFWNNIPGATKALDLISSPDNLYGVNVMNIRDAAENVYCKFELDMCSDDPNNMSSIKFTLNNEDCLQHLPELNTKLGINSECYDDINISTNTIVSKFNGMTIKPNTFINIPTISATTTRKCYGTQLETANIPTAEIKLKLLGNEYTYNANANSGTDNDNSSENTSILTTKNQISSKDYKYILEDQKGLYGMNGYLGIDINNQMIQNNSQLYEKIITQNEEGSKYAYFKQIDTSKVYSKEDNQLEISGSLENIFGTESANIIEKLKGEEEFSHEEERNINEITYRTKVRYIYSLTTNGDSYNCPFAPNTDFGGFPEIQNAKFRVISLDNPFPARDGTSRMPGKNWLNATENNVYEYIENNRGVKTEEVYTKEPLYKITLDTSTMVKIREYNKLNSYGNFKVNCEGGMGIRCISPFLRDTNYISNMEGTCAGVTTENRAGIFYTCADKTEASSGYNNDIDYNG